MLNSAKNQQEGARNHEESEGGIDQPVDPEGGREIARKLHANHLTEAQEDGVEAHYRASICVISLRDISQEAERCWGCARNKEQQKKRLVKLPSSKEGK